MFQNVFKLLEFLPLSVFLIYTRLIDTSISYNWRGPFITGGSLALLSTVVLFFQKVPLNRIFLGINIHLFTGGLAFITQLWWLLDVYQKMLASGMLAWVIIVGVVTLLFSPLGFICVDHPDKKSVRAYSFYLLLVTAAAFVTSLVFQSNRVLSQVIPFIALFIIQGLLKSRISEGNLGSAAT